jgi:hypothetical protein
MSLHVVAVIGASSELFQGIGKADALSPGQA